jgi:hypothetical protein
VERRGLDHVVVERPQRVVREALVVEAEVVLRQLHRDEPHVVGVERLQLEVRRAAPADPRAVGLLHDGLEGGHEAAGGAGPARCAVLAHGHVDREAVRDDDQVITSRFH